MQVLFPQKPEQSEVDVCKQALAKHFDSFQLILYKVTQLFARSQEQEKSISELHDRLTKINADQRSLHFEFKNTYLSLEEKISLNASNYSQLSRRLQFIEQIFDDRGLVPSCFHIQINQEHISEYTDSFFQDNNNTITPYKAKQKMLKKKRRLVKYDRLDTNLCEVQKESSKQQQQQQSQQEGQNMNFIRQISQLFLSDRTEDEETNGNTMLLKVNPPAQRFIEAKLEEKIKSQVDELILNESYRLQEVMDQRMASFAQQISMETDHLKEILNQLTSDFNVYKNNFAQIEFKLANTACKDHVHPAIEEHITRVEEQQKQNCESLLHKIAGCQGVLGAKKRSLTQQEFNLKMRSRNSFDKISTANATPFLKQKDSNSLLRSRLNSVDGKGLSKDQNSRLIKRWKDKASEILKGMPRKRFNRGLPSDKAK